MMNERTKMRYVSCPCCGKQLFKFQVSGNASVEITCTRCRKDIVGVVDEIFMKIYESSSARESGSGSYYSTDMDALRESRKAM